MHSILLLKTSDLRKILIFLILFSVFVQIEVYGGEKGASLGLYHILLIPGFFILFDSARDLLKYTVYWLFFSTLAITSVVCWLNYGAGLRAFLLPIAILAFVVGTFIPRHVECSSLRKMIMIIGWITVSLISIRFMLYFNNHVNALQGSIKGLAGMPFLSTGGAKAGCSNVVMLGFLLVGTRTYYVIASAALFLSVTYQARGAFLLLCLSCLNNVIIIKNARFLIISMIAVLVVILLGSGYYAFDSGNRNVYSRFLEYDKEVEFKEKNIGRLSYMQNGLELLEEFPAGVGVGNSMSLLREHVNIDYRNNNMHNIYLIILVEGGAHSFLLYLIIVLKILFEQVRYRFKNYFGLIVCAYFFLGMFQYMAYDVIGWLFIGIYEGSRKVYGPKVFLACN